MESMRALRRLGLVLTVSAFVLSSATAQRPPIAWMGGGAGTIGNGFYFYDGQYFVTFNNYRDYPGNMLQFWRLSDNKLVRTLMVYQLTGKLASLSAHVSPMPNNSHQIVLAYRDTDSTTGNSGVQVEIWEANDPTFTHWTRVASGGSFEPDGAPDDEPGEINTLAVDPSGRYFAIGGGDPAWGGAGFVLCRLNGSVIEHAQFLPRNPSYAYIASAHFSPDGTWLFAGSAPNFYIYKWDGSAFQLHQTEFIGNGNHAVSWATTSRIESGQPRHYFAVGILPTSEIKMYRYNPAQDRWTLYLVWTTTGQSTANDMEFFPGGDYLAVAYGQSAFGVVFYDPFLRVFQINYDPDPDNRSAIPVFQEEFPNDMVLMVELNDTGTELFSGTRFGDLRRWDVETQTFMTPANHRGPITALAWSPDGSKIATSAETLPPVPTQTFVWDFATQSVQTRIAHPTASWIGAVAFSPDGNYLATVGRDIQTEGRPIELWNANTGEWQVLVGFLDYNGSGLIFSPDGQYLYAADRSGVVKAFQRGSDWLSWTEIARVNTLDNAMSPVQIDLSPDGTRLAVGTNNKVFLLSTPNLSLVQEITVFPSGTNERITSLDWSPDGRYIAVGCRMVQPAPVYLIDATTGTVVHRLVDDSGFDIFSVSFTPDGCYLMGAGSVWYNASQTGLGHNLFIWHTGTGALVATYDDETLLTVSAAAFSPDGRYIAYGRESDGSLIVANNPFYRRAGDVDRNSCVDDADLLTVLFHFGGSEPNADLNCDGVVDDADLLLVLFHFGEGC